ncbi:DUF2325 domain-containing protein [Azoarcus sp. DN11]|uniref:DUF2325 domain-containing protein n=1 Tax=Azoarcus sp. DN11 TaxID=356837 RepID=UPI000EAF7C29|nr:DUF2325 domain-containing protein [Azoarcus sp. DN11]AYH42900.1 hypothetical protein CDA09_05790 [Azoarcus sp. DN11]
MTAVIVGGDRVASYRDCLSNHGYAPVRHWDGRRGSDSHRPIPADTRLVVIIIDQVNHGLASKMRRLAKERGVPVIYCRRCLPQLDEAVSGLAGR